MIRGQAAQRKRWDIGVAEPVVMSEKSEFSGPWTGSWNNSSSSVRKEGARIHGASGIRSINRKVSDDVACDLAPLLQYFLTVLIVMCGSTARSSRLKFC
jgi:hypothetical protein